MLLFKLTLIIGISLFSVLDTDNVEIEQNKFTLTKKVPFGAKRLFLVPGKGQENDEKKQDLYKRTTKW